MTRPLRVLHIVDCLRAGGTERAIWDLVRLSDRSLVAPRVVTVCAESADSVLAEPLARIGAYTRAVRRIDGGSWSERLLDAMPRRGKERLWSMLGPYDSSARSAQACGRIALEYLRFRPDIIHGHAWYGLRMGAWLKSWTGVPLVYSVWNRVSQLDDDGAGWVVDDYRRLHAFADAFSAEEAYRAELVAAGLPAGKMHSLAGTIDFSGVSATLQNASHHRAEVRRRLGIPADAPMALSVGRLTPSKGHRHALEALQRAHQLPGLHWVVLGEGEEREALEQAASALGVRARTHLPGYVDDPHPYYAAADLFLRTFELEGDTRASFDAMAFGLPVAAFETGCGTDRIPRAHHGLRVPTGDAAALAGAIVEILALPDRGRAMGLLGQADARRNLDVRRTLDMFSAVYRELAA